MWCIYIYIYESMYSISTCMNMIYDIYIYICVLVCIYIYNYMIVYVRIRSMTHLSKETCVWFKQELSGASLVFFLCSDIHWHWRRLTLTYAILGSNDTAVCLKSGYPKTTHRSSCSLLKLQGRNTKMFRHIQMDIPSVYPIISQFVLVKSRFGWILPNYTLWYSDGKLSFIVRFPSKNGGCFHSYVNVYQRVHLHYRWFYTRKQTSFSKDASVSRLASGRGRGPCQRRHRATSQQSLRGAPWSDIGRMGQKL